MVLVVAFYVFSPSYCTNADTNFIDVQNTRPSFVNVGALFAFNSAIGRVAKTAIELAVNDVNNNENLLNKTKLVLTMSTLHGNCGRFSTKLYFVDLDYFVFTRKLSFISRTLDSSCFLSLNDWLKVSVSLNDWLKVSV